MFNRSLISKNQSRISKDQNDLKTELNKSSLGSNKINIRRCNSHQSLLRSQTSREINQKSTCPVKVQPKLLQFSSIEPYKTYQMSFVIRNQSNQIQKVRIIPPVKKQFKFKLNETFNGEIASGLSVKIPILFSCQDFYDVFEDKLFVMGNSFKHEINLIAQSPKAQFSFEKILNLGTLIAKQQTKIDIPIKNIGTLDGSISIEDIITNEYCPNISYQNRSLSIPAGKTQNLQILVKPITVGQLQLKLNFSILESCTIKALVVQDQVQIIEKNGSKVSAKDFGQLFFGQKVNWSFLISNGTQHQVDCILQTFNHKKQNFDVKVDKKRNIFISQSSPKQFSASVQSSSFSLEKSQFSVKPFQSLKNTIYIQKIPSNDQIQSFIENLTKNIQSTIYKADHQLEIKKNLGKLKDPNLLDKFMTGNNNKNISQNNDINELSQKDKLINQTLAVKFQNQQKILKIPIKFLSKIPNLQIDVNFFQFGKIYVKQTEVKQFVLKNYSNKKVKLSFNDLSASLKENFKIEGPQVLEPLSEQVFKIIFRPLIKKKFAQTLRINVFQYFPIEIKIFGQCLGLDGSSIRNQMNLTMTDRKNETSKVENWRSLLKERTQRQTNESFNQTLNQTSNKSLSKTKNTKSLNSLLINPLKIKNLRKLESSQEVEIAKIVFNSRQQNMSDEKLLKSGLFFKKQDYLSSIKRKGSTNQPKNTREISRFQSLRLQELNKIEVSEKKLQFGHVFIGSQMSKKVTIKNRLECPILFQLDTLGAEALKQNSQDMVKIQACGMYQIDVVFSPKELGEMQLPLNYVINKQHVFEIKVMATVTLVNLQLSARMFVFDLQQEDPSFQKQETLRVYNNGNRKTKFNFQPPENPSFKLSIMQGELQPKSSINVQIIYAPFFGEQSGEQRIDVQKLKLKVHQGAQNIIKCTGTVKQPKIVIKQTQFKCQNAIISVPITNKINIKNLSKVQTYIKVDFQPVNPKQKRQDFKSLFKSETEDLTLNEEQKKQISFTFLCHQIRKVDAFIVLSIRGYRIVKIPFSVNLIYPQIATLTPQIDFGDAPIMGNTCIEMFSLINMTQADIKIEIDPNFPKDQYFCEILPVDKNNLQKSNSEDERMKTFLSTFSGVFKENRTQSRRKSLIYNKVLILPPNGNQNVFNLKFVPKLIKKYDVQLPVRIYGTVDKSIKPIKLQIKCNAVEPQIYVEPRIIKFDSKVINETKITYKQTLYISNPHNFGVKFKVESLPKNSQDFHRKPVSAVSNFNEKSRKEDLASMSSISGTQIFAFSQYQGEIQPNGKTQLLVIFRCTAEGSFFEKFNICLLPKNEKDQEIKSYQPALSSYVLDVSGSAIMPTLKFNCNEAIMPVVPLNLESRLYIMIENHGYDAITVCKWKTSNHFPHTEIKVNFVQGKLLSLAKKSLRIQILFSSLAPISFTTILQFYDQYGNKYELPLSCTADNSIFTSFPYLESDNAHSILYINDEKMIKIISTGKNSYYEQNKQITGNHKMGCSFIKKWLNFQLNMNIDTYPETIIESDGIEFVKMVNRIASKNIIKKFEILETQNQPESQEISQQAINDINESKNYVPKKKISKILQLFELYSDTIKRLKQEGAFLNQIRPEFLLNFFDYKSYQNHKKRILLSEQVFEVVSVESWMCLFYQLSKVYVEPQINDKIFAKMKTQNSILSLNLTSNLYSSVEIMLIKFVNFYLSNEDSKSKTQSNMVVSFSEQIKIFEVIQRILETNFNLSLSDQISSLKSSVSTMSPHVFLSTIAKFLHVQLKQYGLSAYLNSTDLFTIGVKQLILYLINLVQMIYHYSNVSCVKFEGAVGDKITKVIELQNPSSKKVSYFVKIVNNQNLSYEKQSLKNSKNMEYQIKNSIIQSNSKSKQSSFIPEKTQITIEPKQKAQLKVVYHCKNAKGQTSSLYLIPSKQDQDSTMPQPLLFKLTTTILSKIVMKKIILSTSLYEVLPIHLDVELPSQIPQFAEFTLSLFEQTPKQQTHNVVYFNPPSFIFGQAHVRTLKEGNKDSLELKLVPLTVGEKICRISYFSLIYGEFVYEIYAKVSNPKILKQIKMKELKVNLEQEVTITIGKQNDFLYGLTKIYYPDLYNFHCRSEMNLPIQGTKRNIVSSSKINFNLIEKNSPKDLRYEVQILDTQFLSLAKGSEFIEKLGSQNKIVLKTLFTKPFKEYPVILSVKNDLLKDKRLYKLIFVAISPPKIIKMQFKTTARQQIIQKIPIKLTPCDVTLKSNCECFKIQSLQRQYYTNTQIFCKFAPRWIQDKEVTLVLQNKESLQQLIYQISLKAQEPQSFGSFQLVGSSLFNQEVFLAIDVQAVFLQSGQQNKTMFENKPFMVNHYAKSIYFEVKRLFKRPHLIEAQQFYPFLNQKSSKSHTGIYTKTPQNPQVSVKQSSEKSKNPKTRSMVDDKNIKYINMTLYPSETDNETGSIRLVKPNTEEYYWARISIKNRSVEKLKQISMQEKINMKKIECLQDLLREQEIDFGAGDFEFKFFKQTNSLKFAFMQMDQKSSSTKRYTFNTYGNRKRPVIVFSPIKETQSQNVFYFRANNKEYMLPIKLRAQNLPTIVVPQITTTNIQPKLTYLNLINSTDETGTYKVVIIGRNQTEKNQCFKFIQDQQSQKHVDKFNTSCLIKQKKSQDLLYHLKPKQKKQIRIAFAPKFIHQKQKLIIKFQSQTLPNYTYILNGRSQFKVQQQKTQFEVYQNHIKPFHVKFTNLFQKKQQFTIDFESLHKQKHSKIQQFIKIQDPSNKRFNLEEGQTKVILISLPEEYFNLPLQNQKNKINEELNDSSSLKLLLNIRVNQKVVKKYELNLFIIKNLFPSHNQDLDSDKQFLTKSKHFQKPTQKIQSKYAGQKYKNEFFWSCKARQTVYQNIEIPDTLNFFVKQIKSSLQISKYLTFTCISQEQKSSHQIEKPQTNFLKLKFSPMKPIKKKNYDLILIGLKGEKYRIQCEISVDQPPIDDTILIKTTQIDQVGCVSFKLTNITKSSAKYKAYFVKKLPEFSLETQSGILEGYGKPGTHVVVKFKSHINNRRLQDKLILETDEMYWCFKVKGMVSKD